MVCREILEILDFYLYANVFADILTEQIYKTSEGKFGMRSNYDGNNNDNEKINNVHTSD